MSPILTAGNVQEMSFFHTPGHVKEMPSALTAGNVQEIVPYSYCIRKCQGNVKISCHRKWARNVNYPVHFQGFLYAGNSTFLPVIITFVV